MNCDRAVCSRLVHTRWTPRASLAQGRAPISRWCKATWSVLCNSEPAGFRALQRSVRRSDEKAQCPALETWAARVHGLRPMNDQELLAGLAHFGQAKYVHGEVNPSARWQTLARTLPAVRRRLRMRVKPRPFHSWTRSSDSVANRRPCLEGPCPCWTQRSLSVLDKRARSQHPQLPGGQPRADGRLVQDTVDSRVSW